MGTGGSGWMNCEGGAVGWKRVSCSRAGCGRVQCLRCIGGNDDGRRM